jgi:hypothetical protein
MRRSHSPFEPRIWRAGHSARDTLRDATSLKNPAILYYAMGNFTVA